MDVADVQWRPQQPATGISYVLIPAGKNTDATTQTLPMHNILREVLVNMVVDHLKAKGLPLIACPHTKGLQLGNIVNGIVDSHSIMCTQTSQHQVCQQQGIPLQDVNDDHLEVQESSQILAQGSSSSSSLPHTPQAVPVSIKRAKQKSKVRQSSRKYVKHGKYVKKESWDNKQKSLASRKCAICDKTFRYPSFLKSHMIYHTTERPFKCEQCDYYCKTKMDLKKHVKRMHLNIFPYYCQVCGKGVVSKGKLTEHTNTHLDKKDYPVKCMYCNKGYTCEYNLMIHLKVHEKSRQHKCDICSTLFAYHVNYKEHLKKKHGVLKSNKSMMCLICDQELYEWRTLLAHMKEKHKGEHFTKSLRTKCDFCPKTYSFQRNQLDHMRLVHKALCSAKSKKCLVCDLELIQWELVVEHMKDKHQEYLLPPVEPKVNPSLKPSGSSREQSTLSYVKLNDKALVSSFSVKKVTSPTSMKNAANLNASCSQQMVEVWGKNLKKDHIVLEDSGEINKCIYSRKCWLCGKQMQTWNQLLKHVREDHKGSVIKDEIFRVVRNVAIQSIVQKKQVTNQSSCQKYLAPNQSSVHKGLASSQSDGQKGQASSQSNGQKVQVHSQSSIPKDQISGQSEGQKDQVPSQSDVPKDQVPSQSDIPKDQASSQSGVPKDTQSSQSDGQKDQAQVKCDFCSQAFTYLTLHQHLRVIHRALNGTKSKKCLVCDLELNEWPLVVEHMKQNHKHLADYDEIRRAVLSNKCWVCDKKLNESCLLVTHMKDGHNIVVQMKV